MKFNRSGVYLATIGSPGSGDGQFNDPQSMASDASGNLFVADPGNHRMEKFDTNGGYLSQFGSVGSLKRQFNDPVGLAVDLHGHV